MTLVVGAQVVTTSGCLNEDFAQSSRMAGVQKIMLVLRIASFVRGFAGCGYVSTSSSSVHPLCFFGKNAVRHVPLHKKNIT